MNLTWELIAIGALALANFVGGVFLKRLIAQIDNMDKTVQKLTICVSKQNERWVNHERIHAEHRQDRKAGDRDMWAAIQGLRGNR